MYTRVDSETMQNIFAEAVVMKKFEHRNVLKLHGVTLDDVHR